MQSINRLITTIPQTNSPQVDLANLNSRIEENRPFLDDLRKSESFQKVLILIRKEGIPEERLLNFLSGKVSLEKCLGEKTWMIDLLINTYGWFEIRKSDSHFLSGPVANTLSIIFKPGFFESAEKSHSKMGVLMGAIENDNHSQMFDLGNAEFASADLPTVDLIETNLSEAEVSSASTSDSSLSSFTWLINNSFPIISDHTDVMHLKSRIEENRPFLDELKGSKSFQNLLILMRKAAVPEERLLGFLIGKASLEECWGEHTWMTDLLDKTYTELEIRCSDSHFLPETLTATLSTIFNSGYFESTEKSHCKISLLMDEMRTANSAETLDLSCADLSNAFLCKADLSGANLSEADLSGAVMREANLSGALLPKANLTMTYLSGANLAKADLSSASVSGANLSWANLSGANLHGADLSKADLSGANLSEAFLPEAALPKGFSPRAKLCGPNST